MRKPIAILVFCLAAAVFTFGQDLNLGTWKLNEAKSKIPAGSPKNSTVTYETVGDQVKVTVEGTDPAGKDYKSEWTGKYDGKDYPLTGDPTADARAYKKVNARTLDITTKKGGKVQGTAKIVVAADGKSRTVTAGGSADGKKYSSTAVYDKQ